MIVKLRAGGFEVRKDHIPKEDVQKLAQSHGIETEILEAEIDPGWVRRAKGLRQVLWERGLLDPLQSYTVNGPKDIDGMVDPMRSYKSLMSNCMDFRTELTALQNLGNLLGVAVGATLKYHAELAGEGIEYVWALSKNWFKRQPLAKRKKQADFKELVIKALSPEVVQTTKVVRGCGRRARSYVLAYLATNTQ